jgi:protein-S-isoprenylcysteine O-methyltransferase Ste14
MIRPDEEEPPKKSHLRIVPFVIHATRGLVRDQNTRRKTMFVLVLVAVVMLFVGATFLAPVLNPRERPGWFILYWLVCAWVTATAVLLALFDLLLVRAEARKQQRLMTEQIAKSVEARDAD